MSAPAARIRAGLMVFVGLVCLGGSPSLYAEEPASAVGPLMKLFQSGRLPPARQPAVVEMICNRGNEHDLRVVFDRIVAPNGFSPELRLKALGWLTDAAVNRKVKPAGDLAGLAKLAPAEPSEKELPLALAVLRLASTWQVKSIGPQLQSLATAPKASPRLQQAALEGLVAIGDEGSRATITKLTGKDHPLSLRIRAATGLVSLDTAAAAKATAAILADAAADVITDADFGPLLDAFFNRKDGADQLAAALKETKLDKDVAKLALRYMYSVGRSDASLSGLLGSAAGMAIDAPPPSIEELARITQEVTAKGNATRGEKIFRRADVSCMKCHSVVRAGGQVGPDLSAVGGSSPVDYIVTSILIPNQAVKEQYVTKTFAMADGRVFTGIVSDRDEVKINLRDAAGKQHVLPTADVDEEVEGKSLMPPGLTKFLTHDELLDLAKFVSELGKPGDFGPRKTPTLQRFRRLNNPPRELTDEVPHLENVRQFVFDSKPEAWSSVYAQVSGVLPLDELRVRGTPTVAILQGEIEVTETGTLGVKIKSTETVHTWLDGDPRDTANQYEAQLTPGRHTITLRVEISDRVAPELSVELIKPADSTIQFDVVGGA